MKDKFVITVPICFGIIMAALVILEFRPERAHKAEPAKTWETNHVKMVWDGGEIVTNDRRKTSGVTLITNDYLNGVLTNSTTNVVYIATNPPVSETVIKLYVPGDYMLGDIVSSSNAITLGPPPGWKILCADNPDGQRLYVTMTPGGQISDVINSPAVRTSYMEAVVVAWRMNQAMFNADQIKHYGYLWKECDK